MIQFLRVSKIFEDPKHGARLLLKNVTAALPTSKVCEITAEGQDATAKSLFLRLTSGAAKPEEGRIHYGRLRVSPLLNSGNMASLLFNQMTVRQNILFQARLTHFNRSQLIEFVVESCSLQGHIDKPVATLNWPMRRALEVSIFTAIPYDCYLVDFLDAVPDYAQMQLYFAVKKRGAGMFFATGKAEVAKSYRDMSIVVQGGGVTWYEPH